MWARNRDVQNIKAERVQKLGKKLKISEAGLLNLPDEDGCIEPAPHISLHLKNDFL